ncbi:TorF family putative porin [Thermaurantiacus sp.]
MSISSTAIFRTLAPAALAFALAAPAAGQEAEEKKPFSVSGTAAFVTDYRFRGVSQSDNSVAVQAGMTVSHESGLYAGFWSSSLAGWGTFGGPNVELDLFAGYAFDLGAVGIDTGFTVFTYPGGADTTTFVELYVKASGTIGPVGLTGGIFYAPKQTPLGNWSNHPESAIGDKEDNLYLSGDFTYGIKGTPITAKAHIGYSNGNPGLGPNGTSIAPTGSYADWLIGADVAVGPLTLGFAYVDTSISDTSDDWFRLQPNFSKVSNGKPISNAQFVFSVTAAF